MGGDLAAPRVHQQPHGHRHKNGAPVRLEMRLRGIRRLLVSTQLILLTDPGTSGPGKPGGEDASTSPALPRRHRRCWDRCGKAPRLRSEVSVYLPGRHMIKVVMCEPLSQAERDGRPKGGNRCRSMRYSSPTQATRGGG